MALGPRLIVPEIVLPSQFISMTTCERLSFVVPQSPVHVPFNGCPNCADAGSAVSRSASSPAARQNIRIENLLVRNANCIPAGNELPYQARIRSPSEDT